MLILCYVKKWGINLFVYGFFIFFVLFKNNLWFFKLLNICIVIYIKNKVVFVNYSYLNGKKMKLLYRLLKIKCIYIYVNNILYI